MSTVFSHIVQKRLRKESENVATAALAFILDSSEAARNGMMKLLRGVAPQLPPRLWFRTQQTDDDNRPDMRGVDSENTPHVFVENKFWAGLTENQPVSYLRSLAKQTHPTILLMVAPEARLETLWWELNQRLDKDKISVTKREATAGIVRCITTGTNGPILALTSWAELLSSLERELAKDSATSRDLLQLRSLCEAMDCDAVAPISAEEVSHQRTPAFILQLSAIVQASVDLAVIEGALDLADLRRQANFTRIGRYAYLGAERQVCIWVGIHFGLWKAHGGTPLWVVFSDKEGRSREVRPLLEPWAAQMRIFAANEQEDFAVALNLPFGEEKDAVIRVVVDRLKAIAEKLSGLEYKPAGSVDK